MADHGNDRAPSFRVRRGRSYDLNAVVDLYDGCGLVPSARGFRNELERRVLRDPDLFLIAVSATEDIVGALSASFDGRLAVVSRLATHAAHRRVGVATALVRRMSAVLEELGAAGVDLVVIDDTPDAMMLWDALGYERRRRAPVYRAS